MPILNQILYVIAAVLFSAGFIGVSEDDLVMSASLWMFACIFAALGGIR